MIADYGEQRRNATDMEKPKNLEKEPSLATLSTKNRTWIDPGPNPDIRGERPLLAS
jgi:hypothetical protein